MGFYHHYLVKENKVVMFTIFWSDGKYRQYAHCHGRSTVDDLVDALTKSGRTNISAWKSDRPITEMPTALKIYPEPPKGE